MKKTLCHKPIYSMRPTNWNDLPVTISMEEACNLLLCADNTVARYAKEGLIIGRKIGNKWLFDRDSIRHFILGGGRKCMKSI